jgi:DNA-directed RNA polymerase specialized sigma24 family protein
MALRFTTDDRLTDRIADVYGAALTASGDEAVAASVSRRVLTWGAARPQTRGGRDVLVERAILLAVRLTATGPFAAMRPDDRKAVALARLMGYSAVDVAMALEVSVDEVKRRMLSGLEALTGRRAPTGEVVGR